MVKSFKKGESNMLVQFLTTKQRLTKLSVVLKLKQHSICAAKNCVTMSN